jgi:TfoX/Sxy family transcriptional regulator of competence genes
MAFNEKLAQLVREALADLPEVEEKTMFRGVTFMVNGKMCVNVVEDDLMCRIDPAIHEEVIQKRGCRTMVMKGKEYKGYVLVDEEGRKTRQDFDYWINLALDFNKRAKAAPKRKKK